MGKYSFEDLGEQGVKNIAQPIRAFRMRIGDEDTPEPAVAGSPTSIPPAPEPSAPAAFELTFWESIQESKDPAEFAAYLHQYPQGTFTELAEARQRALLVEQATPTPVTPEVDEVELSFWDTVKTSDNPAMFAAYLEQYPEGSFAALAKVRLEELAPPD